MKIKNVVIAVAEAERFIDKANDALARQHAEQAATNYKHEYWVQCQENAACKRASLDLSRALSKLRRP